MFMGIDGFKEFNGRHIGEDVLCATGHDDATQTRSQGCSRPYCFSTRGCSSSLDRLVLKQDSTSLEVGGCNIPAPVGQCMLDLHIRYGHETKVRLAGSSLELAGAGDPQAWDT